jgi:Zn finger protein HypA/HybF involved in hydrogenase expression
MPQAKALHHQTANGNPRGWSRKGHRAAPETFSAGGYHSQMRRVLSFALVVLLVLRGLMGTAMAEGLAPAQPAKIARVAEVTLQSGHSLKAPAVQHSAPSHTLSEHAAHAHSAAPADMETHAAACEDGTSNACSHEHSASCPDCDICHSAMLALPAMPTRSLRVTGAVRPAEAVPFASVPAARTIKPPIA